MFRLLLGMVVLFFAIWYRYHRKTFNMQGKWVLVTGTDSGFGKALVLDLLAKGCNVFATCLNQEGERGLISAADGLPGDLHTFILDVTDESRIEEVKKSVEEILKSRSTHLWGLVNNAGYNDVNCPDDWLTLENYQKIMDINCYGAIRMTKAFVQSLKMSEGRVIFVSSVRGRLTMPEAGPYTMSKYAMEAYADTVRQELYFFGVKVAIIEPGGFQTKMADDEWMIADNIAKIWEKLSDEMKLQWPYATLKSRADQLRAGEPRSTDFSAVTTAMVHGLFAENPRSRYLCGDDAMYRHRPLSFLPGAVQDYILRHWMYSRWIQPQRPLKS